MVSRGQCGDLGQVVGVYPLSGPGFRSLEAVHAGAVPAVCALEGADAAFASGSPFDGSAEGSASFQLLSGRAGFPFVGNDDGANTQVGEGVVDGSFAVPAVGGHGAWCATGPVFHPLDCGSQLWCVRGVSGLHIVIENDAVVVVDDLPFVTELGRFPQPALRDRARGRPPGSLYAPSGATLAGRRPVRGGCPRGR
jgi:hypothetical protein